MASLTISEVAKQTGLRTSAIRYYEEIGILDSVERVGGQRRYDRSVFYRLSIVQRAQQAGFTLDEIQELLTGFVPGTPAPERWKQLSSRKIKELAAKMDEIQFMQSLLKDMMTNCQCDTLETCGKCIFHQIHQQEQS
ncbi:MerR family transcriptional regulator [Granulicella arctica]|uniref:MerR family transcriptional regulator n=1 Tax=Granulicella arctica TaxID=940613 RepID=UPI0021DF6BAD|nr:MerR family transcriptional regulator [Granulicella arctica]